MPEETQPQREFKPLSERFEEAFKLAHELHRTQSRKQSPVPYIAHLMSVAAMVLEHGGDEDQAIAALLHDGPEDQGGRATLSLIRDRFGDAVADLVKDCSEPLDLSRAEWKERKRGYLSHLSSISDRAALIAGCDKVHNARSLLACLKAEGERAFERFSGKARGTRWWYRQLQQQLGPHLPPGLRREFEACAAQIEMSPNLPVWHGGHEVWLQTSPQRYWSLGDMARCDRTLPPWRGIDSMHVHGPGSMALCAFVGARAARFGVHRLLIERIEGTLRTTVEVTREQVVHQPIPVVRLEAVRLNPSTVLIRAMSGEKFEAGRLAEVSALATSAVESGDTVVITGLMPVALAGAVSFLAVSRGAQSVACITPAEGMSLCGVHGTKLGQASPLPREVEEVLLPVGPKQAMTVGVIGFPNAGKSVLAKLLGRAIAKQGVDSWTFEADPASPTPWWYIELQREQRGTAEALRGAYKVDWTAQMQQEVASRLANARRFFDRVLVDLPGGDMQNPSGPQPIPPGREDLFRQVDRFIILRRPDRNDRAELWIDALRQHGLAERVHAVLDSVEVDAPTRIDLDSNPSPDGWLTGRVRGLSRDAEFDAVANCAESVRAALRLVGGRD